MINLEHFGSTLVGRFILWYWSQLVSTYIRLQLNYIFFQAGIKEDQLTLALEPEAASIYCHELRQEVHIKENKFLPTIKSGMKFMVIDLGGRFDKLI